MLSRNYWRQSRRVSALTVAGFFANCRIARKVAPREGFEPPTDRLTADCSTTELPRKDGLPIADTFAVSKSNLTECATKFQKKCISVIARTCIKAARWLGERP